MDRTLNISDSSCNDSDFIDDSTNTNNSIDSNRQGPISCATLNSSSESPLICPKNKAGRTKILDSDSEESFDNPGTEESVTIAGGVMESESDAAVVVSDAETPSIKSGDSYPSVIEESDKSWASCSDDSLGFRTSTLSTASGKTWARSDNSANASSLSHASARSISSATGYRTTKYLDDELGDVRGRRSGSAVEESERSILERKIREKTNSYMSLEKAYKSCNPNRLKDGGQLLLQRKKKCEEELEELKSALNDLHNDSDVEVVDVVPSQHKPSQPIFSTNDQVTTNLGKRALQTHRVQMALTVDTLTTLHSSLQTRPTPDTLESDPEGLKVALMPHQKHGLAWLLWREKQQPLGGILADDMGLGKTLTLISLVLRFQELQSDEEEEQAWLDAKDRRLHRGGTLVVCPASLIGQWESEVKVHCKRHALKVLVHHGPSREDKGKALTKYDLVITTYGIVGQEWKNMSAVYRVDWTRIILDEAHVIRNHKTKVSQAVCALSGTRRWCLTGTPVHNKELDFFALLKFLRCSPFDDLTVWKQWVDNKSPIGMERLNTVVKSILLRRTKEELKSQGELQGLPDKNIVNVYFEMEKTELKVYQEVLNFSKTLLCQYLHQKQENALAGMGLNTLQMDAIKQKMQHTQDVKTHQILVLLLRLRQICCLPGLIRAMLSDEECQTDNLEGDDGMMSDLVSHVKRLSIAPGLKNHNKDSAEEATAVAAGELVSVLHTNNEVFVMERPSTKMLKLMEVLREILYCEDKVVIVSQWSTLLHILKDHVRSLGVRSVILDGKVPVKDRPAMIEAFNRTDSGPRIMLLALTVGGVGLNLVGANRLVIFEPHWNPQLEAQACDRVYRVGQKKPVVIYKLICKNSIEGRIEDLQKSKLELSENVLRGEAKRQNTKLTLADLKTLFGINT